MVRFRYLALAAGAILGLGALLWPTPLPPLVAGAESRGPGDACMEGAPSSTRSPELSDRLSQQFPPGAPSSDLKTALVQQGFKYFETCPGDSTIHRAIFCRGFPRSGRATVYWKVDGDDRIVWTSGAMFYLC